MGIYCTSDGQPHEPPKLFELLSVKKTVIVGVSELKISKNPNEALVTYALGSCIGVAVHDPKNRIGGILHYQLPLSKIAPEKAIINPAMFADTGIPALFRKMYKLGSKKEDLVVRVAGGAVRINLDKTNNIGKKNHIVLRKILWKNNIMVTAESVGGTTPRSIFLDVETGFVFISDGRERRMLTETPAALF